MFDSTRSLFEGWIRVLAGAALATVGISIALGLELALIEPWLSIVLARRMAGDALPTIPVELFVVMMMFVIVVVAALFGCARVARAFRLPPVLRTFPAPSEAVNAASQSAAPRSRQRLDDGPAERSRAAAVATMMVAMERREMAGSRLSPAHAPSANGRVPTLGTARHESVRATTPVGRSFSRRSSSRVSGSASRRDGAA
jgi:type IV secretion system protein VirB6